jgi:hypothetical protein
MPLLMVASVFSPVFRILTVCHNTLFEVIIMVPFIFVSTCEFCDHTNFKQKLRSLESDLFSRFLVSF